MKWIGQELRLRQEIWIWHTYLCHPITTKYKQTKNGCVAQWLVTIHLKPLKVFIPYAVLFKFAMIKILI